jgi:hypothetical protein
MFLKYITLSACFYGMFVRAADYKKESLYLVPKEGKEFKIFLPGTPKESKKRHLPLLAQVAEYIPPLKVVMEEKHKKYKKNIFSEIPNSSLKTLLHAIYYHKNLSINPSILKFDRTTTEQKCMDITGALEAAKLLQIPEQHPSFVPYFIGMCLAPSFYDLWVDKYGGKAIMQRHREAVQLFLDNKNIKKKLLLFKIFVTRPGGWTYERNHKILGPEERMKIYVERLHEISTEKT